VTEKKIIGRKDKADFPELGLENIPVKVDTGAYTSSIHCTAIEEKKIEGEWTIIFRLLDEEHPEYNNREFRFTSYQQKRIKNSFGDSERRYIIRTSITLFGESFPVDLSLSERGQMKYPVLLGRKLLNRRFIVDTQKTNLSSRKKKSLSKKK